MLYYYIYKNSTNIKKGADYEKNFLSNAPWSDFI